MDAYELHDARFIQSLIVTSAANALFVQSPVVPKGKIWTVLSAFITTSATETQDYWFAIKDALGYPYPVTKIEEFTVNSAIDRYVGFLTEGMEIKIYPGERVAGLRDAATLGSNMSIFVRFIETDLPYYSYVEPQRKVVSQVLRHGSIYRGGGGGGGGGPLPGGGPSGGGEGGGGGGAEPY